MRRRMSWQVGTLATLVAFVVVALGASAGQSAPSGSAQTGIIVSGTTDAITNIDPAGNYDYPSFMAADILSTSTCSTSRTGRSCSRPWQPAASP